MQEIGRKLTVLFIDDQADQSGPTIKRISKARSTVFVIRGMQDAIKYLHEFAPSTQIDVILCDVAMEHDPVLKDMRAAFSVNEFVGLPEKGGAKREDVSFVARPTYAVKGLEVDDALNPYGPILALPFIRFFRNGGIIMPISAYWTSAKLLSPDGEPRLFNGYVYTSLALIWAHADKETFELGRFGEYFSLLYQEARRKTTPDIERIFYKSVRLRRLQLYRAARVLPDLLQVRLEQPGDDAYARISDGVFRVVDATGEVDIIDRQSLYADIDFELANPDFPLRKVNKEKYLSFVSGIQTNLDKERFAYTGKCIDLDAVYQFCGEFITLEGFEVEDSSEADFVDKYNLVADKVRVESGLDIGRIKDPIDAPPYIRRYLLLFGQLYMFVQPGEQPENETMCNLFGFRNTGHTVKGGKGGRSGRRPEVDARTRKLHDLVLGGRKNLEFPHREKYGADWVFWMRPFNLVSGREPKGWEEFQILVPPAGSLKWMFMDVDRYLAQRFWNRLTELELAKGELGFNLTDRVRA